MSRSGLLKTCRLLKGRFDFRRSYSLSKRNDSSDNVNPPELENPLSKTMRVLGQNFKSLDSFFNRGPPSYIPSHCDVLIIGGGIMGSSAAYWLKQRALDGINVIVVEKDCSVMSNENQPSVKYTQASTVLSVGGIRQQFSLKENIEMSLFGAEFLRDIKKHLHVEGCDPPDVQFTPTGYLFLATDVGAEQLKQNSEFQQSLGAKNELLSPEKLKSKFPWINTENIALGCHGLRNEGWFDPWSLLDSFKRKAISLGAYYMNAEAIGFEFKEMPDMFVSGLEDTPYEALDKLIVKLPNGDLHTIKFGIAIIAAGANSSNVAKMARIGNGPSFLQIPLPVEPRKRYVYCFHCPDGPGLNTPLTINPDGTYFRREGLGGNYIGGRSPDPNNEPSTDNLDVDHEFFNEHVWPSLAHRVKNFENIKVKSAWAGFYEYNTFDANGIVGPHPFYHNLYIATGFSGHGIQHGPAVGRALMEMIVDGDFQTIDLTRMHFDRFITDKPIYENNIW